jgi:hypothetical protein
MSETGDPYKAAPVCAERSPADIINYFLDQITEHGDCGHFS